MAPKTRLSSWNLFLTILFPLAFSFLLATTHNLMAIIFLTFSLCHKLIKFTFSLNDPLLTKLLPLIDLVFLIMILSTFNQFSCSTLANYLSNPHFAHCHLSPTLRLLTDFKLQTSNFEPQQWKLNSFKGFESLGIVNCLSDLWLLANLNH